MTWALAASKRTQKGSDPEFSIAEHGCMENDHG